MLEFSKVKSGTNTTGIQKHVQRENNNYENEDIDHSKTHLNYDLVNDNKQNFNNLIEEKLEQNYTSKRKIRTDAVKHIDGLITSDNEFLIIKHQKIQNNFLNMLKIFWNKNTVKIIYYMPQCIWTRKHHICIMVLFQ
ncbi:plasmid recombination protein [Staphylococcus aureus]|nr:plasmid recombination protein [Staphylococcus aureus]